MHGTSRRQESGSHYGQSENSLSSATNITKKLIRVLEYKSELQSLLRKSNKNYESKVSLLPIKARLCILRHPAYSSVQSEGQNIYFELLKHPIQSSQRILRDDATITLDSFEYFLICLLRYPTTDQNDPVPAQNPSGKKTKNDDHQMSQQTRKYCYNFKIFLSVRG